jgi:hypothetical protein
MFVNGETIESKPTWMLRPRLKNATMIGSGVGKTRQDYHREQ